MVMLLFAGGSDASEEDLLERVVLQFEDERVAVDDLEDGGHEVLVLGGDDGRVAHVVLPDADLLLLGGALSCAQRRRTCQ